MRDFYNTQCYPALEDNPWTFVAGPYDLKQVDERKFLPSPFFPEGSTLGVVEVDTTTHTINDCPTVYIIDSPRWNYEVRAYLDIDPERDPQSTTWLVFMLSQRWADIRDLIRNDCKKRQYKGILPDLTGTWGLRSPVFGNGMQLDAVLTGHKIRATKWRKVSDAARPVELSFLKLKEGKLEDG